MPCGNISKNPGPRSSTALAVPPTVETSKTGYTPSKDGKIMHERMFSIDYKCNVGYGVYAPRVEI